jgi:hypothetical protein
MGTLPNGCEITALTAVRDDAGVEVAYSIVNHASEPALVLDVFADRDRPGHLDESACFHVIDGQTLVLAKFGLTSPWAALYIPVWPRARLMEPGTHRDVRFRLSSPLAFYSPWLLNEEPLRNVRCDTLRVALGFVLASQLKSMPAERLVDGVRFFDIAFESVLKHQRVVSASVAGPIDVADAVVLEPSVVRTLDHV